VLNILFLKSKNDFAPEEKREIENSIREVADRTINLLKIKGIINITVYPFVWYILGKPWVGGVTKSKEWFELTVPPKIYLPDDLEGIVYHELHHIAREYSCYTGIGGHRSLLNSIFSEGLATAFEMEQVPQRMPVCADYDILELKKWFPELKEEMWNSNYNHEAWFLGKGKPWWLGYKIGKYLVDQISINHSSLSLISLVRANVKELLELSGGL